MVRMIANEKLQAIIWATNLDKAGHFYMYILGFFFVKRSYSALVCDGNEGDLTLC